jgi:hypothetical protein
MVEGVANACLAWLMWEKSAFVAALPFTGYIHRPPLEQQKNWEAKRLSEMGNNCRMLHPRQTV